MKHFAIRVLSINHGKDPVVRAYKVVSLRCNKQGSPRRPHTGVHNNDMDAQRREVFVTHANYDRGLSNVEFADIVGQVNNIRRRVYPENNALHNAAQWIFIAEICHQGDNRIMFHMRLP